MFHLHKAVRGIFNFHRMLVCTLHMTFELCWLYKRPWTMLTFMRFLWVRCMSQKVSFPSVLILQWLLFAANFAEHRNFNKGVVEIFQKLQITQTISRLLWSSTLNKINTQRYTKKGVYQTSLHSHQVITTAVSVNCLIRIFTRSMSKLLFELHHGFFFFSEEFCPNRMGFGQVRA